MTTRVTGQACFAFLVVCVLSSAPALAEPDILTLYPDCIKLHSPADAPVRQAACERATRDPSLSQHKHAVAYFALAIALRAQNKIDLAVSSLQQAIRLWPEAIRNHLYLAEIYFDRGDMISVLTQLEQELTNDDLKVNNEDNLDAKWVKNKALAFRIKVSCKLGRSADVQRDLASWNKLIANVEDHIPSEERAQYADGVAEFKKLSPPECIDEGVR